MTSEQIKEAIEIGKEMEKECINEKDLHRGKTIYNAPAIFSYERDYKKTMQTFLDLAQSYLSAGKEMPEERPIKMPLSLKIHSEGFNEARRLCIMAKMRSVLSVEVLEEIIQNALEKSVTEDKTVYNEEKLFELLDRMKLVESITQAIHARIVEKTR